MSFVAKETSSTYNCKQPMSSLCIQSHNFEFFLKKEENMGCDDLFPKSTMILGVHTHFNWNKRTKLFFRRILYTHILRDDPARQVSLDFVLASANGTGLSFAVIRTSHTLIKPSEDAETTKLDASGSSFRLLKATSPFIRDEWASWMLYATLPLVVSHAVMARSSPPT